MRKIISYINKTINRLLLKTEWYREKYWKGTTKFWYLSSCDYDIVNLGSSSGKYAFNYEKLPIKGMNWAIAPQSLVHDYNILKNYFSYLKEGAIVLIPICPFSCLFTSYSKESNFKYYPILHPATIIDFDESERTRAYRVKLSPFKEMPFYCIKETIKELFIKTYRMVIPRNSMDFDKNAESWINLWKQQFEIHDLDAPMSDKHKDEQNQRCKLLREIILFCLERNLKPYIVLPPIHPSLSSKFSTAFMKNYVYDFVYKAIDDKSLLLDYFQNNLICEDKYFINSYLLNKKGAIAFSKIVFNHLKLS
ncbi:MAG: hypothetical protein E7098_00865 [Mediterranea massiliensis]|nr:hypothetical protein [Mediterranea massiliensis]